MNSLDKLVAIIGVLGFLAFETVVICVTIYNLSGCK